MEKNANLHRDVGGSTLCATIAGEMGDIKTVGGMKGVTDTCKNSERSLSTLGSCTTSSSSAPSTASNAISSVEKLDMPEMFLPVQENNIQSSGWSETLSSGSGDHLSNGMGNSSQLATGNSEGATSKLVNNKTDGEPSSMGESGARITDDQAEVSVCASVEPVKLAKPTHLCPDKTNTGNVKCGVAIDNTICEGLPSGSDPCIAAESRSIDSLESFSNLNSCPSFDLNSDGLEDRGLALTLQSEYGADGTKIPCTKDRGAGQSIYHIKWIKWKEENTPIITQNENGPCPLLAIMNVLLLAWKVKMPPMMEIITAEQLMEYLGDYILDAKPKEISEAQRLNYEQ
ncbi:ubiquitin carboxyl-terminal hydrolase MINDY-2-like, partial [Coregonus clupeaformis]|uniref:ubiquitin carboxyl-terminal hydrolase MINDY-2-like n=1 Tax=Coregonus clupeaformis TaxID=59861 RepID=UPI001E1C7BD3